MEEVWGRRPGEEVWGGGLGKKSGEGAWRGSLERELGEEVWGRTLGKSLGTRLLYITLCWHMPAESRMNVTRISLSDNFMARSLLPQQRSL